jgi:hypothetical protein
VRSISLRALIACPVLLAAMLISSCGPAPEPRKVGVIYVFHGGSTQFDVQSNWDSTMQIFAYDPNSRVYRDVIWNPQAWPMMLRFGNAPKEMGKYSFEYERIGYNDPANDLTLTRYRHLQEALEAREEELGINFIVDYASWRAIDPPHHIHPRYLFEPRVPGGSRLTYCGSTDMDGVPSSERWPGCTPDRYDTDGTAERLLKAGVDEIIVIDMTTSGVRFFKTFDVVNLARQVVARHNEATGDDVKVWWVNDPTDLVTESYPEEPAGWTLSLGEVGKDRSVPLEGRPNPVSSDPQLALFHVEGIEAQLADGVPIAKTGVLLVNHATRLHNQYFDPKIDDTLVLNRNIKELLLERHPALKAENVLGSWFGMKTPNPNVELGPRNFSRFERTREMRGENLGDARLYETRNLFPDGDMGYRYWEALEALKDSGVEHIVVAFPQIMVDSVLNLVEVPNQIAKEIGYKNWLYIDKLDFERFPGVGHPFADYWGVWVDTQCEAADGTDRKVPCCFDMGGCGDDARPYPPPRQTPIDKVRKDLDPSLAYDVSEFGHLGYDPALGPPDPEAPVQDQYRGTWVVWTPPNDNPMVGKFLAEKVLDFLQQPRPERAVQPVFLGQPPEPANQRVAQDGG